MKGTTIDGLSIRPARLGPLSDERRELESPYLARERTFSNDPTKQRHRAAIARFFLRTLSGAKVHCLSLPSYHWAFEGALAELRPDSTFVGIERNRTVLNESVPYMPGRDKRGYHRRLAIGHIDGWASTNTKHLCLSMGDFIALKKLDVRNGGGRNWQDFQAKYRRFSCAWLDFQSMMSGEVENALRWLPNIMDANVPVVPIAVTAMVGREQPDVTARIDVFGGRGEYMRALLGISGFREVAYMRTTRYLSPGGCPMSLTIMRLRLAHRNSQTFKEAPGAFRGVRTGGAA